MKRLNEEYLQQRIEELENLYYESDEHPDLRAICAGEIQELKLLLANCEEVEVEEIDSLIDKYSKLSEQYIGFTWFLKEQGFKLIKTK